MGHPYYDVVDNTTDFESKIRRVIELICKRIGRQVGADIADRLKALSKKRRFLVQSLPDISVRVNKMVSYRYIFTDLLAGVSEGARF